MFVLGGADFGKWLGHEGEFLVSGFLFLQKWPDEVPEILKTHENTIQIWPCRGHHPTSWHLDIRFLASRSMKNKFLLLIGYPVFGILLQQPKICSQNTSSNNTKNNTCRTSWYTSKLYSDVFYYLNSIV